MSSSSNISPATPATNKSDAPESSRHLFSKEPKRKLSKKGKQVESGGNPRVDGADTTRDVGADRTDAGNISVPQASGGDVAASNANSHLGANAGQDPPQPSPAVTANSSQSEPGGKTASAGASEKERDKGSLSTTLTGTATTSKHRKDKTASDGAHSSSTEKLAAVKQKAPKKPKRSFLSRLFHTLVPCIGSSTRPGLALLDDGASVASDPSSSAIAMKEKNHTPENDQQPIKETAPPITVVTELPTVEPSTSATEELAPLTIPPDVTPPTPPADAAVVVPPSPNKHVLPESETAGVTSGAVQPPGSTGDEHHGRDGEDSDGTSFTEEEDQDKELESAEDEEERLIMNGGIGIPIGPDGVPRPLLPPIAPQHAGRKCLVLDMDETLLHSSFKSIQHADYVIPVEIEYHWHNVYVIKRPGVDNFLKKMGELYEVVVFTASLSKYADPVLDKLDVHQVVSHRLFRESCYNHKGNYVKDLSQLGRPMADTIILDNSPASYIFHPNNAVPVSSWFNDPHDTELTDLCPFLADLRTVDDVRGVLDGGL